VKISYGGQAREGAGCASEELAVPDGATVAVVLAAAAHRHEKLWPMLMRSDGRPHPSVLVIVGDEQRRTDDPRPLPSAASVTILTPVSGG
jgi:molybdopterin converting factor small subunit